MLSGSGFDASMPESTTTEFALYEVPFTLTSALAKIQTPQTDGGFITSSWQLLNTGQGTTTAGIVELGVQGIDHDGYYTRAHAFVIGSIAERAGDIFASDGLQPASFDVTNNGIVFNSYFPTFVINPSEKQPEQNEGGAIPLHPILADIRAELTLASRDSSVSASAKLTAASEKAISGELARAVIFEFAGDNAAYRDHTGGDEHSDRAAALDATPGTDDPTLSTDINKAASFNTPTSTTNANAVLLAQQPATHAVPAVNQFNSPAVIDNLLETVTSSGSPLSASVTSDTAESKLTKATRMLPLSFLMPRSINSAKQT